LSVSSPAHGRPHVLPSDLPSALGGLADDDLRTLALAVDGELSRRRLKVELPASREGNAAQEPRPVVAKPSRQKTRPEDPPLTTARMKAVRAAFKAGVKPAMIAREFNISPAMIRRVLSETSD